MYPNKEDIEMCRKAVEIQELWKPIKSDLFYRPEDKEIDIRFNYVYESKIQRHNNKPPTFLICYDKFSPLISSSTQTWLPRQDQLWEIRYDHNEDSKYDIFEFSYDFSKQCFQAQYKAFITHYPTDQYKDWCWLKGNSKEEILLKYVMKENFNKTWNGKEWTSQNK